jgi:hypothetical protein
MCWPLDGEMLPQSIHIKSERQTPENKTKEKEPNVECVVIEENLLYVAIY